MSIELPDVRAHRIRDSASGKTYYVIVKLSEDKADFEKSTIDLQVTDSSSCWEGAGIRGQPAPKDWMRNVYRALSSKQGSYDIEVKSISEGLKVTIRWHEADLRVRASLTLPSSQDQNAMSSILNIVFESLEITQDSCASLTSSNAELRQRADSVQAQLQKVVDSIQKEKQEIYIKFAAVVNEKKQKLREQQQHIQRLEEQLEGGPDQENGSGAASPPRDIAEADHDSVYDAETEPSAGEDESKAQVDVEDTCQTLRRPAGTFGIDQTLTSHGKAQSQANGKAPTTRSQAEKDALLAADTLPMEADEDQNEDEEMQDAVAEPAVGPEEQPASLHAHPGPDQPQEQPASAHSHPGPHQAEEQPASAARPPAKPSGLARSRRR